MLNFRLDKRELAELCAAHREALNVREAYRINAVILLGRGYTAADVAEALLIDPDTARTYFKRYKKGGVEELLGMNHIGSEALLDEVQLSVLDAHLQEHLHETAESVARWVEKRWGVRYTPSGMTAVLHRLGYSYKKAKLVPGKADAAAQEQFIEDYENVKENSDKGDVIMFMDATHPQHNPVIGNGWLKRGKEHPIKSNTGRRRLNINGAIDIRRMSAEFRFDDTAYTGVWTANGGCTGSGSECVSNISASWSATLTATRASPPSGNPEPATIALFGFGLALAGVGYKRRKAIKPV